MENKINALNLINDEIHSALINGTGNERDMAIAIDFITNTARKNLQTRFGCEYHNSKNNLSYVVTKQILPVLAKINISQGENAAKLLPSISDVAKPSDIDQAERVLKALSTTANANDKNALILLASSLNILRTHFSPNTKKVKKSSDAPFCEFCYREALEKSDSCEDHQSLGRVFGKKHLKRYKTLKTKLKKLRSESRISNDFVLEKLKAKGINSWDDNSDYIEWINLVLTRIRAFSSNNEKISDATKTLISTKKAISFPFAHNDWPIILEGTLFRYEVCELMKYKVPSEKAIQRLNHLWSGNSITQYALKLGIRIDTLKEFRSEWSKKVNKMRNDGVDDRVIRLVLGLKKLP